MVKISHWTKRIILLYLILILLKIVLAYFILAPSAFSDDYGYVKLARSFFYHGVFMIDGNVASRPLLYSIILSPAYIFGDMGIVFFSMKLINAIISSLIIFPAWLMSKEFFNEKKAMLLTTLVAVLPAHFGFTFFIMSENLFYPLFLFSIYFIYKSFTQEGYTWDVLAGIFIGLTYLTKVNGLVLIPVVLILFLYKIFKKEFNEIEKKAVMAVSFLIAASPWLIRNGILFGFNKSVILGSYDKSLETTLNIATGNTFYFLLGLSIWVLLYLGYLMIASGFIFFPSSFMIFKEHNKKKFVFTFLTLLSTAFLTLLAARQFKLTEGVMYQTIFSNFVGNGRIIGRYVEAVVPLLVINGLSGIKYIKKIPKIFFVTLIMLLILSSQLVFFQLFPINNMSLSWMGVLKFILDFLAYGKISFESIFSYWSMVVFSIFLVAAFLLIKYLQVKFQSNRTLYFFIAFFFLVSLLNFAIIFYNSYTYWYNSEQTQMGLWFNKYDPQTSVILFDERDGCKISKTNQTCIYNPFRTGGSATVIGFWMNDEIVVGSVENLEDIDYVVSRHKLDLPLLKETKNGIFLYKVDREG